MGRLTGTEKVLLCAACAAVLLTIGVRLGSRRPGAAVITERIPPSAAVSAEPEALLVDINSAGEEELCALPGIGPALAGRIIEYREANGPFKLETDLINVSGIGETKLAALLEFITVGETP